MSSQPFRPTLGLPTLGLAAMGLFAPAAAQTPAPVPLVVPEVDVQGIGGRSYQGDAAVRPGPRSATPIAEAPQTINTVTQSGPGTAPASFVSAPSGTAPARITLIWAAGGSPRLVCPLFTRVGWSLPR